MTPTRNGLKWNVNELLTLQREYELLQLPIQEIAERHNRTVDAILYKLYNEVIIEDNVVPRGYEEYVEQQEEKVFCDLINPFIDNVAEKLNDATENYNYTQLEQRVIELENTVELMKCLISKTTDVKQVQKKKRTQLRRRNNLEFDA